MNINASHDYSKHLVRMLLSLYFSGMANLNEIVAHFRSGRPRSSATADNVDWVKQLIAKDPRCNNKDISWCRIRNSADKFIWTPFKNNCVTLGATSAYILEMLYNGGRKII